MRFKAKTFVLHAVLSQKRRRTKNKNTPPDAQAGVCVNNEISFRIYGAWQHKTYFSPCLCFNPPARSSFIDFNNISMLSRLSFSLFVPPFIILTMCFSTDFGFSSSASGLFFPDPFFIPLEYRFFISLPFRLGKSTL